MKTLNNCSPETSLGIGATLGRIVAGLSLLAAFMPSAFAQSVVLYKAASGTELTSSASWTNNGSIVVPGPTNTAAWVGSSLGGNVTVASPVTWSNILVTAASADVFLSGSAITLGGVPTFGATYTAISAVGNNVTISNALTINYGNGVNNNGAQLNANSGKALTIYGNITNIANGQISVVGAGTAYFYGTNYAPNNSYFSINGGGTLSVTSMTNAFSTCGYLRISANGSTGKLIYTGTGETNNTSIAYPTSGVGNTQTIEQDGSPGILKMTGILQSVGAGAHITQLQGTGVGEIAGQIQNNGVVTILKTGSGTWGLSGNNLFTGGVILNQGQLNINSTAALGTSAGTLQFGGTNGAIMIDNTSGSAITLANNNPQAWNTNFTFIGSSSLNLGSGAVAMSANRVVTVNASTLTVGGVISGTGFSLTKAGAGTLTLGGANSYTGATTVTNGTLAVNGSLNTSSAVEVNPAAANSYLAGTGTINGPVTLDASGTYNAGINLTNGSAGTLTLANGLTLNNGNVLNFDVAGASTSDKIAVTGGSLALPTSGSVTVKLNNIGVAGAATIKLISTTTGTMDYTKFNLATAAPTGFSWQLQNDSDTHSLDVVITASAPATAYWNGAVSANWSAADSGSSYNWVTTATGGTSSGKPGIGTAVIFSDNIPSLHNSTLDAAFEITSLEFRDASGTTISDSGSHALTMDGSLTVDSGAGTVNVNVGSYVLGNNSTTIANNSSSGLNIGAPISGAYTLTANGSGSGTTTLSAANSHNGTTVLNGAVALSGSGTLGGSSATVNVSGGTLDLGTSSQTVGSVTVTGGAVQNGAITGTSYALQAGTVSAALNGSGVALAKTTAGTATLSGNNGYTGGTTISAGALTISGSGTLGGGSYSAAITDNGAFNYNSSAAQTLSGLISGSGPLTMSGNGPLTLSYANTYSGGTTNSAGTLQYGVANAIPSGGSAGDVTVNGNLDLNGFSSTINGLWGSGLVTNSAATGLTLTVGNNNATSTFGGSIVNGPSGVTAVVKTGTGTLTLSGTNTFSGMMNVAAGGAVSVNSISNTLGSVAEIRLGGGSANGKLIYTGTGETSDRPITFTAYSAGSSQTIDQSGGGLLKFAGNFSYSGGVVCSLTLQGSGNGEIAGNIPAEGAGNSIIKTGSGAWALSGANTFVGGVILNQGQLNLNSSTALGASAGTFTLGGTNGAISIDNTAGSALTLANNNPQLWNADFTFVGSQNLNMGSGAVTMGSSRQITVNASTLTIGGAVAGSGLSLTKTGNGTLALNGANNYSGSTTLNGGTLALTTAHAGTGAITVNSGTTLNVTVSGTSQIAPTTLTLGSGTGATNGFSGLANTLIAPINAGTLALNGANVVNITSGSFFPGNSYPLIAFSTLNGSGSFKVGSQPVGVVGTIVINGNVIAYNVSSVSPDIWTGAVDNTWDINTTTNWTQNAVSGKYMDGSPVQFDDTGANTAINIVTIVSPASVTVTNSSQAYSFGGDPISGTGSLTKTGNGTLMLNNTNTYTGSTVIGAGTVQLGLANAIPGGSGYGNVTVNGALDVNGFSPSFNGLSGSGMVSNSPGSTVSISLGNNNASSTFAGAIVGNNNDVSVTKTGSGALTLSGTNTLAALTNSAGTLILSGANNLSGNVQVNGGAVTNYALNNIAGTLQMSGGTANFAGNNTIAGSPILVNGGSTVLAFTGTNSFNGLIQMTAGGTVSVNSISNTLGNVSEIRLGGNYGGGKLVYTGSGEISDRLIGFTATSAGATNEIVDQSGSGLLVFTTAVGTGGQPHNLILQGSTSGVGELAGNIAGGVVTIVKNGTGAWTLSGANSYNNGTVLNAGQLNINSATALGATTPTNILTIAGTSAMDNASGASISLANSIPQLWNADFTFIGSTNLNLGTGAVTMNTNRQVTVNANTLTIGGAVAGSGFSLTKNGNGTLTLNGANTYSGNTIINGGTLALTTAHTGTGAITVNDATTLKVAVSGTSQLAPVTLTLGSANGGTNELGGITNPVSAPINTGTLTLNGACVINIDSVVPVLGTYPLIVAANTNGSGSLTLGHLPPHVSAHLIVTGSGPTIYSLVVDSALLDVWAAGTGNWDISTANWKTNGVSTTYSDGDGVLFDDTASGTGPFTVANVMTISPGAVTVSNASNDYIITGYGITGNGPLTKTGNGTLTLSSTNTYTGSTYINGGILNAGIAQSSSVSGPLGANGNINFGGGTLQFSAATGTAWDPSARIAAGVSTGGVKLDINGQNTINFLTGLTASQSGGLVVNDTAGGGILFLQATNNYGGNTIVNGATIYYNVDVPFSTGNLTINSGALVARYNPNPVSHSITNAVTIGGDFTLGNNVNHNTVTLSGPVNLGNAPRTIDTPDTSVGMVLSGTVSNGGLIKTGAGTLLLSGANNYTGDTTVNAGTLEIGQATLATGSTVSITGGAYLQLDFSTTNQVAALVLDGNSQQPGVYGYGNGYSEYFAGNGYLRVISGPSGPAYITNSVSGSYLSLSWQAGQGWRLQVQTNSLTTGLGTNWFYVTDGSVSSTNIMIDATKPTVFYRLTYP